MTVRQLRLSICESLLREISLAGALPSLNSKKTVNALSHVHLVVHGDRTLLSQKTIQNYLDRLLQIVERADLNDNQKGTALLWIVRMIKHDEQFAKAFIGIYPPDLRPSLEKFFHNQRFMKPADIMQLKTVQALYDVLDGAADDIRDYQNSRQNKDADAGTEKLYENGQWFIAAIHNKGAACELGKGTDWCTAAPGLDFFKQYYEPEDPLIFIKNKRTNERYQFHFGTDQFMDEEDADLRERLAVADEAGRDQTLYKIFEVLENIRKYKINQKVLNIKNVYLAEDESTSVSILQQLAKDEDLDIRRRVASNPSTPEALAAQFVHDPALKVRIRLLDRPNLSLQLIQQLANDDEASIRARVVSRSDVPLDIVIKLADDAHKLVRGHVAAKRSTPPSILMKLANDDENYPRSRVASNKFAPPAALIILSNDEDGLVRMRVARNPSAPQQALKALMKDQLTGIRERAKKIYDAQMTNKQ